MALRLDPTDRRILRELMADGALTNVALAQRVGLSAPPCLRRVRALEDAGVIQGYTALVDERALGFSLTAFAMSVVTEIWKRAFIAGSSKQGKNLRASVASSWVKA